MEKLFVPKWQTSGGHTGVVFLFLILEKGNSSWQDKYISNIFQINKSSYFETFIKGVKNISNSNLFSSFRKLAFLQKLANKK